MIHNEKIETDKQKPVILFAPLDWGLGHTTRCIPLIAEFLEQGCNVVIACNSIQKNLLEKEFPAAAYVFLEGYNISYASNSAFTRLKLLFNVRNILIRIKSEHSWFTEFFSKNTVDAVISDNRYGLYHPEIPCILITHQLSVHTGSATTIDHFVRKILYKWINKFSQCWIPDFEKQPSISGALGHPEKFPSTPVKYIGALSRFELLANAEIIYDVLVILSGPEPQRTLLESIFLNQLQFTKLRVAIVRGLPGNESSKPGSKITIIDHASAIQLNKLICQSSIVISRSGYTTIMDLLKLHKKMILIPTPGQPEQEYLAGYLSANDYAVVVTQNKFSLEESVKKAESFPFKFLTKKMDDYKAVVQQFVATLK